MNDKMRVMVMAMFTTVCWGATALAQTEGAAAPAAPAAPPAGQVPKPAPENEVIKKSAGNWRCEGSAKGPDGQEAKYKSSWAVKPILGGHWYSIVYKRAKMGPLPAFEGHATVGYNTVEKKYSFVGFDSLGGWINLSSADGAAYAGEGSPMGKKGPVKFVFSPGKDKKGEESDKLFDVMMDFGGAGGSESCKK
jgi:Protein of unknown function (DUF1579)